MSGPPPPPAPLPSSMAGATNPPPPPPSSVAHHVKNESRESSEFEFLGGNGGKSPVRNAPLQGKMLIDMSSSSLFRKVFSILYIWIETSL